MPRSKDGGTSGEESSASSPRSTSSAKAKLKRKPKSASSSSDFEFTVSLSPTSAALSSTACPADELFYKGQLLPLHLPPRISMVRSLLLSSSSSSSNTTATTSRDSNGSTSSSFSADLRLSDSAPSSSRPSSVTDEEVPPHSSLRLPPKPQRSNKYLSSLANRFSSVFLPRGNSKKDTPITSNTKVKPSPKEVLIKYVKKVKPLYEKLSSLPQKQNQNQNQPQKKNFSFSIRKETTTNHDANQTSKEIKNQGEKRDFFEPHHSKSFSGNLKYPRRKRCAASCPSSMHSSPSHSGLLSTGGGGPGAFPGPGPVSLSSASSMEELQSAIEGAIAHCKSSLGSTKIPLLCTRSMEFDAEIVLG
ncbi:hypothetical protein LUZ60_003697 [Juncus effusus]|nr:hypothetical protein LUZ60_003697 [Juncus effusus]